MSDNTNLSERTNFAAAAPPALLYKWGALACFVLAAAFAASGLIYLVGNLRDALGPFTYSLADFLNGPVWAASLVTAISALREYTGRRASGRMDLARLAAFAAACVFLAVACMRSANRQYHLAHPELQLEMSATVLTIWATLIAGMIGAAWHFLGWALMLIGSSAWTSRNLPRFLSVLYLAGGAVSLSVYLLPDLEAVAASLGLVICIWQGILLWKTVPA